MPGYPLASQEATAESQQLNYHKLSGLYRRPKEGQPGDGLQLSTMLASGDQE